MSFRVIQQSLQGGRANNEDYVLAFTLGHDQFAVLCDGLGGYPDGEWAARYFAESVRDTITRQLPDDDVPTDQVLANWLQQAMGLFRTRLQDSGYSLKAQTTFALVWLSEDESWAAHAGDSRIYILDADTISWRSRDHNLYELGILNGDVDPAQTPQASGQLALLYRSVSSERPFKPAITKLPALAPGQVALLSTDGAWSPLQDGEWLALAREFSQEELTVLLETATQRSGEGADNASAIAVVRT